MDDTNSGGGAKELFSVIKRKPALMIAGVVGVVIVFVLIAKKNPAVTAPTQGGSSVGDLSTPQPSQLNIVISAMQPSGIVPQHLEPAVKATSMTAPTSNPVFSTASTSSISIRNRVGNLGSPQGVPVRSAPGGSVLGWLPYGGSTTASSSTVTGPNNAPVSGGAGSTVWTPITYQGRTGYVSNYDIKV